MVVRGRLAFDDQGRLVEIAEDAADPTNPQPSEIDPVEFEELIAQTARAQNLDAGQLVSSLDAAGYDLNNVGALGAQQVSTGEGTINKETYIEPIRSFDLTGQSAGSWANAFDGDQADILDEFVSGTFTPQKSGAVIFAANVAFDPGASGDIIRARIRNTTTATTIAGPNVARSITNGSDRVAITFALPVSVTAGDDYQIQVQDFDSSFSVVQAGTRGGIIRSVVQP